MWCRTPWARAVSALAMAGVAVSMLGGCCGFSACAPPSQIPTARLAIDQLRAGQACSRGLRGESVLDSFDADGRVRVKAFFLASHPQSVRLDILSPMGGTLATLAANDRVFTLLDQREKLFHIGPASQCSVEQFLRVPVPPDVLVQLLSGEAPVVVHRPEEAQLEWAEGGYLLTIRGEDQTAQEILLEPTPETFSKPWAEQRLRARRVLVKQAGVVLYEVELSEHRPVATAAARTDPDGIEADILPSGPECHAEVPFSLRFVVPSAERDVTFEHSQLEHNPPLLPGTFTQVLPAGVKPVTTVCPRAAAE